MSEQINVQWFPGHMAKTRRLMKETLPLVDAVIEIIDARIPISSRNPEIKQLIGVKPHVVMLNKSDYADENATKQWKRFFESNGISAISCDCKTGKGINTVISTIKVALAEKLERQRLKGMLNRPLRIMIVGIPNVGKSSLINRLSNTKKTKVEDRPGVTRGKQWVTIGENIDLLDMPGVLWPKFEDKTVGEFLAFTGAVKDSVTDIDGLSLRLIEVLREKYKDKIEVRYGIEITDEDTHLEVLEKIANKRGMLTLGGGSDTSRAAIMLMDEFRGGKLGKMTLERVKSSK